MCSGTPTLRRCAALWMSRRRGPSAGRSGWLVSEPSPAAQDEDHLAAAAPGETLPGPGLAITGDLETAIRALDAPAKLQQVPLDLPLRTTALHPRRLRRRRGGYERYRRCGRLVEGGELLPGQFLAGLGPAQQRVSIGHVPPWSQLTLTRFA